MSASGSGIHCMTAPAMRIQNCEKTSTSLPPFLPPSLRSSLPSSLPPSAPPSLPPSLPPSFPPYPASRHKRE
jgi:hypothetical protein